MFSNDHHNNLVERCRNLCRLHTEIPKDIFTICYYYDYEQV